MSVHKVKVGFFSFTEVTDPAEHHAYNEWHMLDHLPEQYQIDGVVHGARWAATPECRAARAVNEPPFDAVHYVTLYLMTEPVDRTLREFHDLGVDLRARGRFHRHRRSHLSGPFRVLETAAAPRVLVGADVVPFRPHEGVYVVVEQARDRSAADEHARWVQTDLLPALVATPGVAGAWAFATTPRYAEHPWTPGEHRVTVCWLDDDPIAVAAAIEPQLARRPERLAGASARVLAGPFATIRPYEWDWFGS